jgi:protein phosphatase 2C family protein 2/3
VSRTFGDIEAKLNIFNGNPLVVIAEPEVKSFKVTKEHDFLILACDGVFDEMSSSEVLAAVWRESNNKLTSH